MIRATVQLRWLPTSGGLLNASARRRVWCACPTVHRAHARLHSPWIAFKSPPTCRGISRYCQGQMESSKRSAPATDGTNMYLRARHYQLFPVHSVNYQVVHFASGAQFSGSADPNGRRKVRAIKKTRVGRFLEANPVVRGGQRKIRQRDSKGSTFALDTEHAESIEEEFESDHDKIDIHSTEGALQDSLPTDEELNEILYSTHENMDGQRTKHITHPQSDDNDTSGLNEFDKQYFSDAAHLKGLSTSVSQTGMANAEPSITLDVSEGNEFDQQYFGNLQGGAANPAIPSQDKIDRKKKFSAKEWRRKKPEPVYMDTSAPEGHLDEIEYGMRTQEALKDFDKQLGRMFEDAGQDKSISIQSLFEFEPHETATEFQKLEDEKEHEEVTFIDEMQYGEKQIQSIPSSPLKAKLEAERIIAERKEELRIGSHNLSDLEPEIIKAMKAVGQAKRQHQSKGKGQKGHKIFGSPDPDLPATDVSCSGCGAQFQGQNPGRPGYLPSEKYRDLLEGRRLESAVCQRCWYLSHHQMALDVSIGENDYRDIISKVRRRKALVVVLVDLLDFPCSLIPNLKTMVGEKKPMIIVGNKADLIPRDSPDCHKRITKDLLQACVDAGVCNQDSVKHVCIISAKSGFGIEQLITAMQQKWGATGDVYLLGTANVGKSSLFNRLLHSDYAKAKAAWLISKATISRWPGTTLNLLRFPIIKPTADKIALREERLSEERKQAKAEKERNKVQWKENDEVLDQEAYVKGTVGRSYDIIKTGDKDEKELDDSKDPFSLSLAKVDTSTPQQKIKRPAKEELPFSFRPEEFDLGRWFYDTPGMIHDQQILTKLTFDELKLILPNKAILPKTMVLKPGNTIFIAGMGRLDYLEGHKAAFFTIFTSKALPIRVTTTSQAQDDYEAKAKDNRLKVPLGGPDRMQTFPPLQPVDMTVTGEGWSCSAADVLFSSAGWAAVTAAEGMEVRLRAHTPGGHGCLLRRPALLPYMVNLRGERVARTSPFFKVDKLKLMRYL